LSTRNAFANAGLRIAQMKRADSNAGAVSSLKSNAIVTSLCGDTRKCSV